MTGSKKFGTINTKFGRSAKNRKKMTSKVEVGELLLHTGNV